MEEEEAAEVGSWAVGSRVAELREDLGFSSTCREAPGSGAQRCSSIGSGLYKALWLPVGQGSKQTSARSWLLLHLGRTQVRPQGLALVALGIGGWFSQGHYDLIVSNPPYISSAEIMTLDSSVRDYEPIWALDGGEDGLRFYKSILKYWKSLLRPGGYLLFEVGEGQAETVKDMILAAGFAAADTREDTLGVQRVVIGKTYTDSELY